MMTVAIFSKGLSFSSHTLPSCGRAPDMSMSIGPRSPAPCSVPRRCVYAPRMALPFHVWLIPNCRANFALQGRLGLLRRRARAPVHTLHPERAYVTALGHPRSAARTQRARQCRIMPGGLSQAAVTLGCDWTVSWVAFSLRAACPVGACITHA